MKKLKILLFTLVLLPTLLSSQSIEVTYGENPLEVSPLLGADLTINYTYSSEAGSAGNNIYIGLEILDDNDNYFATISDVTLENETAGANVNGSVSFFIGSINQLSEDLPTGYYYQVKATLYGLDWSEEAYAGYWNTPALTLQDTIGFDFSTNEIAKGADISWMTEMEDAGFIWKDNAGNTKELMPLLTEYELDAVRLRVWVNPENSNANGWCDIDDLVDKAILATAANMDVMICIHYSDHWADPGQQTLPGAWSGFSVAQLGTAVANHTTDILTALSAEGITPKWVQVGNETSDGMLWPTGKASAGGFANYATYVNAGLNTIKSFNSTIKTILHIAGGNDNALFRWNIDGLITNGLNTTNLDIVAMSLYPEANNWKAIVDDTYSNMLDMKTRYNKDVMMSEIGFSSSQTDFSYQFLKYMIEKTRQAEGLGVFYWEPIAISPFTIYTKGAWDADRSPSAAMDAFMDTSSLSTEDFNTTTKTLFKVFPNPSSNEITIRNRERFIDTIQIYDINGRLIKSSATKGYSQTIDISSLKSGLYFLKINNTEVLKFLKK
jgi:arabinogalactan endo-1,4-beta-galactosidase